MGDPEAFKYVLSPWKPETSPLRIALLGKFLEELNECASAVARCIIQGIDESEPVTGLVNREWLTKEIADVQATMHLVHVHFRLDTVAISERKWAKTRHLGEWHRKITAGEVL
jgi:hypothetical protein